MSAPPKAIWLDRMVTRRKHRRDAPVEDGFIEPSGVPYLDFLGHLHSLWKPDWYLEIGTQKGRSLVHASRNAIAVDPEFCLEKPAMGTKASLHMFQQTSDDFFASEFLARNDIQLDFAFLDGMHLFEYLLRDVIGAEARSKPTGRLALHDCVPRNHPMSLRDWDKEKTKSWTGDVWKLIPILQSYRPDLKITVWDCPPTALVVVENLDPSSTALRENYEAIMAEYMDLSLKAFGLERFLDSFDFADSDHATKHGLASV